MSEFDKEKEREKLRKQLEADEERRKTSQQMSELLLKGATMLNVHCDRCASPIFRYEGEEFCPTCGRTVEQIQEGGEAATVSEAEPAAPVADEAQPVEESQSTPDPEPAPQTRQPAQTNAGEALEAAISRLADRAATAEDPRKAGELLDAARTAAETLAIVEGRDQSGS